MKTWLNQFYWAELNWMAWSVFGWSVLFSSCYECRRYQSKCLFRWALALCQWYQYDIKVWGSSEILTNSLIVDFILTSIWPVSSRFCIHIDLYGNAKPIWSDQNPADTGPYYGLSVASMFSQECISLSFNGTSKRAEYHMFNTINVCHGMQC